MTGMVLTRKGMVVFAMLLLALLATAAWAGFATAHLAWDGNGYSDWTQPACQEDEPCWDCTTMGNRICGP